MKNNVLSLVSRSNLDGISKSNTAPQLVEAIIIDSNSKEHPQNKFNQKELPELKKYFTSFIKIETKLWAKSIWKPKNEETQGRSHLIYFEARPSSKLSMLILCVI